MPLNKILNETSHFQNIALVLIVGKTLLTSVIKQAIKARIKRQGLEKNKTKPQQYSINLYI